MAAFVRSMFRTFFGALCLTVSAWTPAQAAGSFNDMNGVWLIRQPVPAIKTADGKTPPMLPAARAAYEMHQKQKRSGDFSWDQTSWCASAGVPRLLVERYPFEILVNKRQIAFMFQWNNWARLVDMTGNNLEPPDLLTMGTANGRWTGDELVIVSRGFSPLTYLDSSGLPHGENMILTERLQLVSPDVLQSRISVEDPDTYSAPWEFVVTYARQSGATLAEDVCLDRIAQGKPAI